MVKQDIIIEKEIKLEMAHRLPTHNGKCCNIHGHSWVLKAAVAGPTQSDPSRSDCGMVMDFSELKKPLLIIEGFFDHSITLWKYDLLVTQLVEKNEAPVADLKQFARSHTKFGDVNITDETPTSENLAVIWGEIVKSYLPKGVSLVSIVVKETCTSEVTVLYSV